MKRIISFGLVLILLFSFASCGAWEPAIEDADWVLEHAIHTETQTLVCASAAFLESAGAAYANTPVIDCTLRAKDNKIEIFDRTSNKTYLGTYGDYEQMTPETASYTLKFGSHRGSAVAEWFTDAITEESEKLLLVTLDEYTLVFIEE